MTQIDRCEVECCSIDVGVMVCSNVGPVDEDVDARFGRVEGDTDRCPRCGALQVHVVPVIAVPVAPGVKSSTSNFVIKYL